MFTIELPASSIEEMLEVGKIFMKNGYIVAARKTKKEVEGKQKNVNVLVVRTEV